MSQFDFGTIDPYVVDGVELADFLNQWRDAIYSLHRGSARPPYVVPGMLWINDSGGPTAWVLQWYVSPTVGDVALFTLNTTTGAITVSASAGGTFAAATLLAQAAASPQVQWNATGNPIDQKSWRMTVSPANGALILASYNDAGVLQQSFTFNRDGTVLTANKPSFQLIGETVLAAASPAVNVSWAGVTPRLIEVWFSLQAGATDQTITLRAMQAGTPNVGSVYSQGVQATYNPNTLVANQAAQTFITITNAISTWGVVRLQKPAAMLGVANFEATTAASLIINYQVGMNTTLANVDGVAFAAGGNNFSIGSYARVMALV